MLACQGRHFVELSVVSVGDCAVFFGAALESFLVQKGVYTIWVVKE